MKVSEMRRQVDPERDAELTRAFHRMMDALQPPPRPDDGVLPVIVGWVRIDVRFLQEP
jgi:hypothetical protein